MVVYTNADFISLNEENLTYSVLVEDKGKIAYIGYNTPLCYRDAKVVDLEGKAVLPAVNDLIPVDCKDAGCGRKCRLCRLGQKHSQGPYRLGGSRVPERPRNQQKPLSVFSYLKCYSKRAHTKTGVRLLFSIFGYSLPLQGSLIFCLFTAPIYYFPCFFFL